MKQAPTFLRHEPCPECRSKGQDKTGNNLGIWADGHKYCFSCGYKVSGNSLSLHRLTEHHKSILLKQQQKQENGNDIIRLPSDYTSNLPKIADLWLKQYGISEADIELNSIGWSQTYERLIFPVYDRYGNLLMWQGRLFSNVAGPKYLTKGFPEKVFHILGDDRDVNDLCIVEDVVSAIKVSRVIPCMPLWGSILSTPRAAHLTDLFKRIYIWLDADKQAYATKRGVALMPFFDAVRVIVTQHDPKEVTMDKIKEYLK